MKGDAIFSDVKSRSLVSNIFEYCRMDSAQDADIRLFCAGDMVAFAGEHPLVQGKYRKIRDKS